MLQEARKFLLAAYHDLPNILFVGSLLIGALTGYLPLVWMAFGLVLNFVTVSAAQSLLYILFPRWDQVVQPGLSPACVVGFQRMRSLSSSAEGTDATYGDRRVAPSTWLSSATFFAVFSIYNSIRVTLRDAAPGTDIEKVDTRRAFSISALLIGILFLLVVFARGYTGCETWLGGALGVALGGGLGIGFWHLLDVCGTGRIPDILQVVGSMAPDADTPKEPVFCVAPSSEEGDDKN